MKLHFGLMTLLLASAGPAIASAPRERAPVALRLVGDDGLSQTVYSELNVGRERDRHLRGANHGDRSPIIIESESNVGWDKLDGRTVVLVTVYIHRNEEARGSPIVVACWENDERKCARDILSVARKYVA